MSDKKEVGQEKVDQALQLALDAIREGKDFLAEQAPEFVKEIITWQRAQTLILTTLFFLAAACCLWMFRKANAAYDKVVAQGGTTSTKENAVACCVISLALTACLSIGGLVNGYWALKVWFAPRLYLIEYLAGLLKH